MPEFVSYGSGAYFVLLGLLVFSRAMDFLSTWIATPNLMIEANPVARWMGWKRGVIFHLVMCLVVAAWTVPAVVICTLSLLVAGRNYSQAWWARALGEHEYCQLMARLMTGTPRSLFLLCLAGEVLPAFLIGGVVAWLGGRSLILLAVGVGVILYGVAIGFFTLLSLWRMRR